MFFLMLAEVRQRGMEVMLKCTFFMLNKKNRICYNLYVIFNELDFLKLNNSNL